MRIRIVAAPGKHDEVTATLESLVGPMRSQPGCAGTRVLTERGEDGGVTFEAEWRTRADLERHLHTRAFRTVLAVMELAAEPPRFEVDELDSRRGFDFVEEVLGAIPEVAGGGGVGRAPR